MGCAPSIHISENRAVYHGGKEAEDAPGPAAPPPLPPGGPRFPHGPKTAASARARGASLAESEPRGSGGNQGRTPGIWRFPGYEQSIGALASGLCHSHSNVASELHFRPTPQLMAKPDP